MQKIDANFIATLDKLRAQAAERRKAKEQESTNAETVSLPAALFPAGTDGSVPPVPSVPETPAASDARPETSEEQQDFIDACLEPNTDPVILIGPAGSGKTFAVGRLLEAILEHANLPPVNWGEHKHLPIASPGIIFCAFTRRATDNIRKKLPKDFAPNCITIHKMLEFEPEYFDIIDEKTQRIKHSMRFVPRRNESRKLPGGLRILVTDEFSMLGRELHRLQLNALPAGVKLIFVGDIYQLTPVMDQPAIADYLCRCKTVELTHVYRTALDNPIIFYATKIRKGEAFSVMGELQLPAPTGNGMLTFHPWKKRTSTELAVKQLGLFFARELAQGNYDPENDQILIPYNVGVGTIELNKYIGTAFAQSLRLPVYEVISGYERRYYRAGESCIYDKTDCTIVSISRNVQYLGRQPMAPSPDMDYWGATPGMKRSTEELSMAEVDQMLAIGANTHIEDGERKQVASHKIVIKITETGNELTLTAAGEINKLDLAYATTIHKAQGSEWRKVYLCLHHTHTMISRETLYTGFTRAKEELYVICEKDSFVKGVARQAIKGNTLEEKAKWLQMKAKLAACSVS